MDEKTLFSMAEAAEYVGLSVPGMKKATAAGRVRATLVSRVLVFERRDLDAFKATRAEWKAAAPERKKRQMAEGRARFAAKRKAERAVYLAQRKAEDVAFEAEEQAQHEARRLQLRAEIEAEMRRVVTRPQE